MAKTLNIAKIYGEGVISDIDKSKYFQLHKSVTPRADLFIFAISLALMEGEEPSSPRSSDSLVRTEYIEKYEALFSSLYFDSYLKNNPSQIDDLCQRDAVYELAEKYANTGLGILDKWHNDMDEETLFYKLINYMDNRYREIKDEIGSIL